MLVLAAPIYYHGMSGQMKCCIDRFYAVLYPEKPEQLTKIAMILSSGMRQNWSPEKKTLGQCSITAFLLQDIYGGEVYGVPLGDGNYHCFNVVGDCVFDLTSEQFGKEKLNYVNFPKQARSIHFAKAEKKVRYEMLRFELMKKRQRLE